MLLNAEDRDRILVIDDEPGPRESLRMLLQHEFDVVCADSVDNGIGLLREKPADVIILDIQMPRKDGIQGLQEIRELDPHVSVLMLTAYGTLQTAQQAIRLGANDYLSKPFEISAVRETVKRTAIRSRCQRKLANAVVKLQEMTGNAAENSDRAEELSSTKTRFSEFVHDMRNPLSAIMGYASLLQQEIKSGKQVWTDREDALKYLGIIDDGVRRCNELLGMWREIESSKNIPKKPVVLADVLLEVMELSVPAAAVRGGSIDLEPLPPDVSVMAHRLTLFRAIQNIVCNAIQALHPADGLIRMRGRPVNGSVLIEIEDNGCGIPADKIDHIFESRYTTKGAQGGMGLGLSIAKKAIEQHGGSIRVKSEVGKGTLFTIDLPLAEARAAEVA